MKKSIEDLQNSCETCPIPDNIKSDLCHICAAQHLIRGKWKLLIIWLLRHNALRFSQLMAAIPNVKQGPLTAQLKDLAESGLILRKSYDEVPPKVEYSLTEKGKSFIEVLQEMDTWAKGNLFT